MLFAIVRAFEEGFKAALEIAWCDEFNARVSEEQEAIRARRANGLKLIKPAVR